MKSTILILLIVVSAALGSPESPDFDRWERDMLAGRFDAASAYAESVAEYQAGSGSWAYRAAASFAQLGNTESAIRWLQAAADRRYSGVRTFETDTDIDPVRSDPRFPEIIAEVRATATERMTRFQDAAKKASPIVVKPRGFDPTKPTPVLLVLHGTGQSGKNMLPAWRRAAGRTGCVLIIPDALRPSGRGYSWTFRDESEWYVEHLLKEAREEFAVGQVILAGFSQGANIALSMGRSHPEMFDSVLPVCGHWEDRVGKIPSEGQRPSWCLVMGERDPWAQTYDAAEDALSEAGMRVVLKTIPRVGHAIPSARVLEDAVRWCLEPPQSAAEQKVPESQAD